MRRIVSLLLVPVAVACTFDRTTTVDSRNLDGIWAGAYSGTTFTLDLTSGGDGLVMGSGAVARTDTASRSVAVMGSYQHPRVTFYMSTPGYDSLSFTGSRSGDALTGTLRGTRYTGQTLTLTLHK